MKKVLYIIIFFLGCTTFSQNYKFGKVSEGELKEQYNPNDSSANATYLYKYRKTSFKYNNDQGFVLETEIHDRIKIYNQEGFDHATKRIRLYQPGQNDEEVNYLKAYTYNLVNGKIEKTKLKNDGIFDTEVSKYYDEKKFTMPNVSAGCIIEYKYKIESAFYSNIDEFVFQEDIPVRKLEYSFHIPEYFFYNANQKGYLNTKPTSSSYSEKITVKSKSLPKAGGRIEKYENDIEFTVNKEFYKLENIPALTDEPYVNNIDNYRFSIKYELSYTQFPNSTIKYYTTTWDDVVKTIYDSENFGNELNKSNYFENDMDALLANVNDPMEKAGRIFNYVKKNVKWNGYYGKYTDKGVRKAYKEQVGNVAEINLMLTAMLRYSGVNANPVLVSTRNNGVPLFPTREGYDYVISAIELENQVVLLDATSVYSSPNILPFRTLNWQGRIIREHGSSALVDLYPKIKAETKTYVNATLEDNGAVAGKIRTIKTNHDAVNYRMSLLDKNRDDFLETLENDYGGIDVSEFEVTNDLDVSKPIIVNYSFSSDNQLELIGDKLFFSPMLFFAQNENPFKLDSREFPIDFGYPSGLSYNINISIPEGYKVESIPESISLKLPDNVTAFKYLIRSNEKSIQISIDYDMNDPIVPSVYYTPLKEYFEELVKKEKEKIVLAKI